MAKHQRGGSHRNDPLLDGLLAIQRLQAVAGAARHTECRPVDVVVLDIFPPKVLAALLHQHSGEMPGDRRFLQLLHPEMQPHELGQAQTRAIDHGERVFLPFRAEHGESRIHSRHLGDHGAFHAVAPLDAVMIPDSPLQRREILLVHTPPPVRREAGALVDQLQQPELVEAVDCHGREDSVPGRGDRVSVFVHLSIRAEEAQAFEVFAVQAVILDRRFKQLGRRTPAFLAGLQGLKRLWQEVQLLLGVGEERSLEHCRGSP